MSIHNNKFETIKRSDGAICIKFDSKYSSECCKYVIKEGIKIISLEAIMFKEKNLDLILPLKDYIEGIFIEKDFDCTKLKLFKKLNFISFVENKTNTINLVDFPKLETLNLSYSKKQKGLESCINLKCLTICNYKSNDFNLLDLPYLPKLEELIIMKSNIVNLIGIERFKKLKKISIYNATNLESIDAIKALSNCLEDIEIEGCKKIKTLLVLKTMKKLKSLIFINANILDGNLSYCEGVEYVGLTNKKHYTHKMQYNNQTGLYEMVKK